MLGNIQRAFARKIWHPDLQTLPAPQRYLFFWLRLLQVLAQDLANGELTLRAMSLVYTSLLAFVPLLAFSFALLKAFGVQQQLEPLLLDFLAPLGEKAEEISARVINFVDNVKAGVLGTLGLLLLLWTVVSLAQKVEAAFNYVWRVREARSFSERTTHYVMVILVGASLVTVAFGLTASISTHVLAARLMAIAPLGRLLVLAAKILPYLLVIAAFTFINLFMPHTYVRWRAALTGGIFAGVLWEFAGWAFAVLTINSTRLAAVYSGFAILIMFMVWIYLCWLILFVGAQVSFYVQNPELVRHGRGYGAVGSRTLERVALQIMYLIGQRFREQAVPWSREELAYRLRLPTETVLEVLGRLHDAGLVLLIPGRIRRYVPGRDLASITLKDIVAALRHHPPGVEAVDRYLRGAEAPDEVVKQLDRAIEAALGDTTLRELLQREPVAEPAARRHA